MRSELRASRGVRLSKSRAFSVHMLVLFNEGFFCVALTSFLPLFAVRVLLAADNDSIDSNKNSQEASEDCLHDNQHKTSNSLGGLSNTKLFDKNQDADNREYTDNLNDDVDPVSGLERVGARPE